MGKKILILCGSPRRGGNTDIMADAFAEAAGAKGHSVKKIFTSELSAGCIGCEGCYSSEDRPCCQSPDFNSVAGDILEADGIVFAAPLYWFGFPAGFKAVIDNFFCFYFAGKDMSGKRAACLSCGESDFYNMYDGMQRNFELISGFLKWNMAGQIYAKGVYEAGRISERDDILDKCRKLGAGFFQNPGLPTGHS